jgi:hypothetical protein
MLTEERERRGHQVQESERTGRTHPEASLSTREARPEFRAFLENLGNQAIDAAYQNEIALAFRQLVVVMKTRKDRIKTEELIQELRLELARLKDAHHIALTAHYKMTNS